jgi:hypothetical protein
VGFAGGVFRHAHKCTFTELFKNMFT